VSRPWFTAETSQRLRTSRDHHLGAERFGVSYQALLCDLATEQDLLRDSFAINDADLVVDMHALSESLEAVAERSGP